MNGILASDYSKITLENDLIQQAFNSNTVSKIEVTGQRNCCPTTFTNSVDFEKAVEPCIWKLVHAFDILNDPYQNIINFKFDVYGNVQNILSLPSPHDVVFLPDVIPSGGTISFEDEVNAWFASQGYTNASLTITRVEYPAIEPSNQFLQIEITGLPSGVKPYSIEFGNFDNCFVEQPFSCEPAGECDELQATFTFPETDWYTIEKFVLIDYENLTNPVNIFLTDPGLTWVGPSFKYNKVTPVIPVSSINEVISQFNAASVAQGYGVTMDAINVDTSTHEMTFEVDDTSSQYRVTTVVIRKGTNPNSQEFNQSSFFCTEEADPIAECNYTATVDTTLSEGITSLYMRVDDGLPFSIIDNSYNYSDFDLTAFDTEVEIWLNANGGGGQDFSATITDGILTMTFTDLIANNTPLRAGTFDVNDMFKFNNFSCSSISNIPDPDQYEPTKVEFTHDTIIVYPEFFGQTEDSYSDGIYNLEVAVTLDNGDVVYEEVCIFVDQVIKCDVAEAMFNEPTANYYQLYESIKFAQECNDCDCDQMCNLYEQLLTGLNNVEPDSLCRCTTC